ncbi:MAG: azurin [Akkermansiaceae bacterium]|nr:azurin [Akkermansiaceae bacterium]
MKKFLPALAAASLATGSVFGEDRKSGDSAQADVKITITGNDMMKYDKTTFEVQSGKVVALTFKNVGALPVEAMGHNVVILKPGTDIPKFALAGIANRAGGFLPTDPKLKELIIATTKILGPNQEETITFTAGAPGVYPYVCTFPGHFGVMQGKMTVK